MNNKINIAEILKDCPKGMELDCTIWYNCTFEGIEDVGYINILVKTPYGLVKLSKEGHLYHNHSGSKCVIFPKGKTTWEGFVPPCQFKDGELAPNKFDITTLKPFESRVLVRDKNRDKWRGQFFSHYDNGSYRPYVCIGTEGLCEYKNCIPFKGNEHLLNTNDDCDEFYKTWKKDK